MAETLRELYNAGKDEDVAMIVPGGPTLTYADLRCQIDHLSAQLNTLGIGADDRVAIVTPNGPSSAILFLAVAATATAAPLNQAYREDEFRFYQDDLNAKALITLPGDAPPPPPTRGDVFPSPQTPPHKRPFFPPPGPPPGPPPPPPPDAARLEPPGDPGSYTPPRDGKEVPAGTPTYAGADAVALVLHT